jgi:amino acid transporter
LYIAAGIGLRRVLTSGIGSRFVPPLVIILGTAMAAGGIFIPDPSIGFPPGTPLGVPKHMSWHSMVHGFAPVLGFIALVVALIILGRRFGKEGQRGFMWVTILAAVATFILTSLPSMTGNFETGEFNFLPLWIGASLGMGYTSFVLLKMKK